MAQEGSAPLFSKWLNDVKLYGNTADLDTSDATIWTAWLLEPVPGGITVTSVSPSTKFDTGKTVTINGSGFGTTQGNVYIGGVAQTVTSWGATQIQITTVRSTQSMGVAYIGIEKGA